MGKKDKDKDYSDVLLEDIRDQNKAILQPSGDMHDTVKKVPEIAESVEKLEYDMSIVKLATTATTQDIKLIKIRTEGLEDGMSKLDKHEKEIQILKQKVA